METYDVIVIGGGHAGIEASNSCCKLKARSLLITTSIEKIGEMSCNPSIGGQAKGQIVREIDILGGIMGRAADFSAIQYRVLNRRKGPAVQALRAQCDKNLYKLCVQSMLFKETFLSIFQGEAVSIHQNKDNLFSVKTKDGSCFISKSVVITAGTFLNGIVHIGKENFSNGRLGEPASNELTKYISEFGHKKIRLKTGTPVRINGKSIDFSKMESQPGELDYSPFSIYTESTLLKQIPCYLTRTTDKTKDIILNNLHLSPLYGTDKSIEGIGPRYCPSIEDKFVKFPSKENHQIFIEPEGWNCFEYYPNGISTSLPINVQKDFIKTIPGLENCIITRPAYAIEYDAFDPTGLNINLMSKYVPGLFFAGQINGTSGYEEAAAQGLVAGINSAYYALNTGKNFVPSRYESYIGVMISDITSAGIDEPYRMFTSRAEYRLYIRDNNFAERLLDLSFNNSLISEQTYCVQKSKILSVNNLINSLNTYILNPDKKTNSLLQKINETPLNKPIPLSTLLKRPGIGRDEIFNITGLFKNISDEIWNRAEIEIKYSSFIEREKDEILKFENISSITIPDNFDFSTLSGLTNEIKQKLSRFKPVKLGQVLNIPGMTPAAVSILIMHLKKRSVFYDKQ